MSYLWIWKTFMKKENGCEHEKNIHFLIASGDFTCSQWFAFHFSIRFRSLSLKTDFSPKNLLNCFLEPIFAWSTITSNQILSVRRSFVTAHATRRSLFFFVEIITISQQRLSGSINNWSPQQSDHLQISISQFSNQLENRKLKWPHEIETKFRNKLFFENIQTDFRLYFPIISSFSCHVDSLGNWLIEKAVTSTTQWKCLGSTTCWIDVGGLTQNLKINSWNENEIFVLELDACLYL